MLRDEQNRLLTETGPGTPMGSMVRRYWIPALLSSEIPEPDGAPVPVRLLGEELVAFRDTEGRVGLLDAYCSHRRTSLVYGRNEDCGLACIYHGWKYDIHGNVLETPAEPPNSTFKERIKHVAYPTYEDGGLVLAYMGPADKRPPERRFIWTDLPDSHLLATKVQMECNYLQGVESAIDTAHVSFLHNSSEPGMSPWGFGSDHSAIPDRAPHIEVEPTTYGFRYASIRKGSGGDQYVRITPYMMPWHTFIPETAGGGSGFTAFVPRDDQSHWAFLISLNFDEPIDVDSRIEILGIDPPPEYRKTRTIANRYLQDQEVMKTKNYTGIYGIINQDQVVQESMGPIVDRSQEHLGVSDKAIIAMRRMQLRSLQAFQEGQDPPGLDPSIPFEQIRATATTIPSGANWQNEFPLDAVFSSNSD